MDSRRAPPGVEADFFKRSISKDGNTYSVHGLPGRPVFTERLKIAIPTVSFRGIVFLGFFAVSVDVLQGDTIFITTLDPTFHATGVAGAIKGGGEFGGPSTRATVKVETSIAFGGAKPPEATPPTVAIKAPAANARVSTPNISVNGTASDTSGIASVQLRVVNSFNAVSLYTPVGRENWSVATVLLTPGTNTVTAIATDNNGNVKEASVKVIYERGAPLDLQIVGSGKVGPALATASLVLGKSYTINATANPGSTFAGWTVNGTNRTGSSLTFQMQEGMVIVARFTDVKAPEVSITSPKNNDRLNNNAITISGKASDNDKVDKVFVKVNDGGFEEAVNKTNWTKAAVLKAGPNTISVFAKDSTGIPSKTNTISVTYVVSAEMHVQVIPSNGGKVAPNQNGQRLEVGKSFTVNATANPGFKFAHWGGDVPAADKNKASLKFNMKEGGMTLIAEFVDSKAPEVKITSPKAAARLNEPSVVVNGTASDNLGVDEVKVQLNNGEWMSAEGTTTWQKQLTLPAGPSVIRVYAKDAAGNPSKTNSVAVTYVKSALLVATVHPANSGTIAPGLNGQMVEVGKSITLTATAKPGFAFVKWEGSFATNKPALKFTMPDAEVHLQAEFKDSALPVVTVVTPKASQKVANTELEIGGKVSDNGSVERVFYRVDNGEVMVAELNAGGTNWTAMLEGLTTGNHTLQIYAMDNAENYSKTNTVAFSVTGPPTYQGIYTGTIVSTAGEPINGLVAAVIRADRSAVVFGGSRSFETNNFSFSFEFTADATGAFSTVTDDTYISGKVTATGFTGTYASTNLDNGMIEIERGTFTLTKQPDTGAQAANAGYYQGSYTITKPDHANRGIVRIVVAANGQVLFNVIEDSNSDDSGGAGTGTVSAANVFSLSVGGIPITGTLMPSTKTINATFRDEENNPGVIELTRLFATTDIKPANFGGVYIGSYSQRYDEDDDGGPMDENDRGFVAGVVRAVDNQVVIFSGGSSFDDAHAGYFEFTLGDGGFFELPSMDGFGGWGGFDSTGAWGDYYRVNPGNPTGPDFEGGFALTRMPSTGPLATSQGFYYGRFNHDGQMVSAYAVVAANGKFAFAIQMDGSSEGGGGIGSISGTTITAKQGTQTISGTLNPAEGELTLTLQSETGPVTVTMDRDMSPTSPAPMTSVGSGDQMINLPPLVLPLQDQVTTTLGGGTLSGSVNSFATYDAVEVVAAPAPVATTLSVVSLESRFALKFFTVPGQTYVVQVTEDLQTWTDLQTITATANESEFAEPVATTQGARFYRVRAQ